MTTYQETAIHSTFDYNLFQFFDCNRPPVHWKKIAQSIQEQDLTKFLPILVVLINGAYKVIDGQGRYLACKHLRLPIWYQVLPPNIDAEKVMILLNIGRTDWGLENYLNFYVAQGYQEYKNVESILIECDNIQVSDVLKIWQPGKGNQGTSEMFKRGKYTLPKQGLIKIRHVSNVLHAIKSNVDSGEFKRRASLTNAISSMIHKGASPNRLISQVKKYPFVFKAQGDQPHYFAMLEHLYNYRKRDKVSFKYK